MTRDAGGAEGDDRVWEAVGDPMRRRLLDLLLAEGDATATALARAMPITRQGVAKHLAVLERAGLVEVARVGREARYRLRRDRLDAAARRMARVLAGWEERLAAIKRLAEEEHRPRGGSP